MLVPTIIFHWWLQEDNSVKNSDQQAAKLRTQMVRVGLEKVKSLDLSKPVYDLVVYDLQDQDRRNNLKTFISQWSLVAADDTLLTNLESSEEQNALMLAFQSERSYLLNLAEQSNNSKVIYDVYNEVLLAESLLLDSTNELT